MRPAGTPWGYLGAMGLLAFATLWEATGANGLRWHDGASVVRMLALPAGILLVVTAAGPDRTVQRILGASLTAFHVFWYLTTLVPGLVDIGLQWALPVTLWLLIAVAAPRIGAILITIAVPAALVLTVLALVPQAPVGRGIVITTLSALAAALAVETIRRTVTGTIWDRQAAALEDYLRQQAHAR